MKNGEKGFSVVEILLFIVILGLIVFVGWYVWYSNDSANRSLSVASTVNNAPPARQERPAPYADWQTYSGHGFTVKYPPKWTSLDLLGDRQDFSIVVFGTHTVAAQGGEVPGTSAFTISVFHKGYDLCDCNPTEYLDKTTDLTHFIRSMNGLLPDTLFAQVQKQTKTIDGVEALKFQGGDFNTPWTFKVGSNVFQVDYIQGKDDVDSQSLQHDFDNFLSSLHAQ